MIYLASPYSSPDPLIMKTRFLLAEQVCASLIASGEFPYSPIVHCHEMAQKYSLPTDFAFWQRYNIDMLRRADKLFILMIEGWQSSLGVTYERDFAKACGIPTFGIKEEGEPWPA